MSKKMKSSGVDWIGDVPSHWHTKRVKDLFSIGRGRVISAEEMSDSAEYPVFSSQTKNEGCMGYISTFDFDREQITWTTDGANAGSVFRRSGKHNCTNVCGTLVAKRSEVNLGYFTCFLSYATRFYKRPDTNGAKIMNGEMGRIFVAFPPLSEQIAIADYLDKTTAIIDKQRGLLERKKALLQEHKRALIHEAVTKGLKPGVPMKASGVDWIGEAPSHWKVLRCADVFREKSLRGLSNSEMLTVSIANGLMPQKEYEALTGRKLSSPTDVKDNYKVVDIGDVVYNKMRMWQGAVALSKYSGVVSPAYVVLEPMNVCAEFAQFQLKSDKFVEQSNLYSYGIVDDQNSLRANDFLAMTILVPPMGEQVSIARHLNGAANRLNKQFELLGRKIELLNELRNSLIHEAVTKGVPT